MRVSANRNLLIMTIVCLMGVCLMVVGIANVLRLLSEGLPTGVDAGIVYLDVANGSSHEICHIWASHRGIALTTVDLLEETETIAPGESRSWQLTGLNYDFLAADCDGAIMHAVFGVAGADMVVGVPGREVADILVENVGEEAVCAIYVAPAGRHREMENRLGDCESIEPGGSRWLFLTPGVYDIQAVACESSEEGMLSHREGLEIEARPYTWTISGEWE